MILKINILKIITLLFLFFLNGKHSESAVQNHMGLPIVMDKASITAQLNHTTSPITLGEQQLPWAWDDQFFGKNGSALITFKWNLSSKDLLDIKEKNIGLAFLIEAIGHRYRYRINQGAWHHRGWFEATANHIKTSKWHFIPTHDLEAGLNDIDVEILAESLNMEGIAKIKINDTAATFYEFQTTQQYSRFLLFFISILTFVIFGLAMSTWWNTKENLYLLIGLAEFAFLTNKLSSLVDYPALPILLWNSLQSILILTYFILSIMVAHILLKKINFKHHYHFKLLFVFTFFIQLFIFYQAYIVFKTPYIEYVFFILNIFLGYFIIHEQYRVENNLLQMRKKILDERQHIVSDIHDSAGYSLMELQNLIESHAPPPVVEEFVQTAMLQLRQSSQPAAQAQVHLSQVLQAWRMRLQDMLSKHHMRLVWRVGDIPSIPVNTIDAEHTYKISLELTSNIVRHAKASVVTVDAQVDAITGVVCITVSDNGLGFEPSDLQTTGQGLRSMQTRAQAAGIHLEIQKNKPCGTRMCFTFSSSRYRAKSNYPQPNASQHDSAAAGA